MREGRRERNRGDVWCSRGVLRGPFTSPSRDELDQRPKWPPGLFSALQAHLNSSMPQPKDLHSFLCSPGKHLSS